MKTNLVQGNFKKPQPQSKLNGQMGLTVKDIAESLGIEPKHVREKLTTKNFIESIKANDFAMVEFPTHSSNGTEYTDYVLDVNAAKLFVATYQNTLGRRYLGYLIKVESDSAAEGLTSHIDPTGLAEKLHDLRFVGTLMLQMADAKDKAEAERDEAIRTKSHISAGMTASAMGTASAAARKLKLVEQKLGIAENHKSLLGWIREYPQLGTTSLSSVGSKLSKYCSSRGFEVTKIDDTRYGSVNVYPREAILGYLKANMDL